MAAKTIAPAILQFIDDSKYPEVDTVASAELSPETLATLSRHLLESQAQVKREIRRISKDGSVPIDTWISRAKELQADIRRCRETARQIVANAEAGTELKGKVEDSRKKVELLETEVAFQEAVEARLDHIKFAKNLLDEGQELAVCGKLDDGVRKLEQAEESINGLGQDDSSNFKSVLLRRALKLKERLQEAVNGEWNARIHVDVEKKEVIIETGLEVLVTAAKGLGIFDGLIEKFGKSFEKSIVRPRLSGHQLHGVAVAGHHITCKAALHDASISTLFKDLKTIVNFLVDHLPAGLAAPLAEQLIPHISSVVEEEWLEPAVPLEISELPTFEQLLQEVQHFVDYLQEKQWHNGEALRIWVDNASPTWIRKRREAALGRVRNLVFEGLKATKTVQRIETQVVSGNKEIEATQEDDDQWDTAWDEEAEAQPQQHEPEQESKEAVESNDDEDGSAWDVPEEESVPKEEGNEDDDAWGWGDGDESQPQSSTKISDDRGIATNGDGNQKGQQSIVAHEMTLRETFTVTSIPDALLSLIQNVISDAETLNSENYSTISLSSASAGLYLLPNLALAIYRATAPVAYSEHPSGNGNMLIYNDTLHLSSSLQSWQSESHPSLRLNSDLAHLAQFSKRAYTSEMDSQRTILADFLSSAQGFSNSTTQPFRAECEAAVNQTIDRLKEVHAQWQPVLSTSALLQSVGSLLHAVTSRMIVEIEDLPDIGEAESAQLKRLCDRVSEARHLFTTGPDGAAVADGRDLTFVYCPSWLKFQYLAEILESNLADIKFLWKEGELSLEFEAEEVVGLIEALFAESQLRRSATADIRRTRR